MSLTDATSAGGPYTPQQVDHWLDSRCGESGSAIWAYEGALYDPLDGRKICAVEGIELVRRLPILSSTEDNPSNLLKMEQLEERGYTVLSRKLFCYPSPEAPRKLLDVIKLRHNSPLRNIPTHQAMALYDCATTFLGRRNGTELVVHTEFPNGKCYWSTATSGAKQALLDSTSTSTMDFTVYTKKRRSDVPELSNTSEAEMFVSPKRSRLIQFGAAPKQEQEGDMELEKLIHTPSRARMLPPNSTGSFGGKHKISHRLVAYSSTPGMEKDHRGIGLERIVNWN